MKIEEQGKVVEEVVVESVWLSPSITVPFLLPITFNLFFPFLTSLPQEDLCPTSYLQLILILSNWITINAKPVGKVSYFVVIKRCYTAT